MRARIPLLRWPRAPQSRMALLVFLLTLSLVFTAVLAYQAQDAARSHRATAERALRDYASFAALEFSVNAREGMYNAISMALTRPAARAPGGTATDFSLRAVLDSIAEGANQCGRSALDTSLYYFELDVRKGTIPVSCGHATPEVRKWLADTIPAYTHHDYKPSWEFGYVIGHVGDRPQIAAILYRTDTSGTPCTAYGFTAPYAPFAAAVFDDIYGYVPLLPPVLVGETPTDSMLSITVTDRHGYSLYRSGVQYPPTFSGTTMMEKYGGFTTAVALRPAMADKLVIGGLPRSRLPLLLVLVGLSAGLVVVALVQLRREYELARLRADFISSISHELRTPLAQVRMFAETLLLGRVRTDGERRRSLEIIDQEARRLTHLVENVLQYSRSERHLSRLSPERTNLALEVREAVEAFAPIAQARRVAVVTHLEDDIVAIVDRGALRQTLINLLDNAVKYGPPGQTVSVVLDRLDGHARITLDDEGPGIAPAERERIWEPFYRLERDAHSAVAGSGIGLSVVRDLVIMHDGTVSVDQAPSGGARFMVTLPISPAVTRQDSGSGTPEAPESSLLNPESRSTAELAT